MVANIFPTVLWAPSTPILDKHGKAPPTCLWTSTVLQAPAFTIPDEHGKTPYIPLGINSMAGTNVCHTRRRRRNLPHTSDINSVMGAYNYLVPDDVGNKDLAYILSLSHL